MIVKSEVINEIIGELGANYSAEDSAVISNIYDDIVTIATDISNLESTDDRLYPYIKKAIKSEYLSRGADGLNSRSEGSISASYQDITNTLRNDIIKGGLRRCY